MVLTLLAGIAAWASPATAQVVLPGQAAGFTWTQQLPPPVMVDPYYRRGTCEDLLAVASDGIRHVTVGCHGTLAFSDDSLTWSAATTDASLRNADVRDVAYSNGTWVAVTGRSFVRAADGKGGTKIFTLRSTDGANWAVNDLGVGAQLTGAYTHMRAIAADGVGGWMSGSNLGRIVVSTDDGRTFKTVQAAGAAHTITAIAYFEGKWYIAVNDGNPNQFVMRSSADRGETWTAVRRFPHTIDRLRVINNLLIAVGENRAISSAGSNGRWTLERAADTTLRSLKDIVRISSVGYVTVGESGTAMRAINLKTWTAGTITGAPWMYGLVPINNALLVVGSNMSVLRAQ